MRMSALSEPSIKHVGYTGQMRSRLGRDMLTKCDSIRKTMLTRLLPRRVMAGQAMIAFVLYFLVNDQEKMCELACLC